MTEPIVDPVLTAAAHRLGEHLDAKPWTPPGTVRRHLRHYRAQWFRLRHPRRFHEGELLAQWHQFMDPVVPPLACEAPQIGDAR